MLTSPPAPHTHRYINIKLYKGNISISYHQNTEHLHCKLESNNEPNQKHGVTMVLSFKVLVLIGMTLLKTDNTSIKLE